MEKVIWLDIVVPCAALFTGIGIFAWRREKPMWFWSGITVEESEIADVRAYNRANGRMWIVFSLIYWVSALLGVWSAAKAGIVLAAGTALGIPCLVFAYRRIYEKYRAR